MSELAAVLSHPKLRGAVDQIGLPVEALVQAYAGRTLVVPDDALEPEEFPVDPSDGVVIAAAKAAAVEWVVSGDHHLLAAQEERPFQVLTVRAALDLASSLSED